MCLHPFLIRFVFDFDTYFQGGAIDSGHQIANREQEAVDRERELALAKPQFGLCSINAHLTVLTKNIKTQKPIGMKNKWKSFLWKLNSFSRKIVESHWFRYMRNTGIHPVQFNTISLRCSMHVVFEKIWSRSRWSIHSTFFIWELWGFSGISFKTKSKKWLIWIGNLLSQLLVKLSSWLCYPPKIIVQFTYASMYKRNSTFHSDWFWAFFVCKSMYESK